MFDPTPSQGLPEAEYIELFNSSDTTIHFSSDFVLEYGRSVVALPAFDLTAQSYAILCRKNNVQVLSSFGQVVGLNNFLLNNSGMSLVLKKDQTVWTGLSYLPTFSEKEGGFSAELIDIHKPCKEKDNWASSNNVLGGTPGKPNSLASNLVDFDSPKLLNFTRDSISVQLFFDENLHPDFAQSVDNFVLQPSIRVKEILFLPELRSQLKLYFERILPDSFSIEMLQPADCLGNVGDNLMLNFLETEKPDSLDLLVNEILFNPPVGGNDYVEIYNRSNKVLNLRDIKIGNGIDNFSISDFDVIIRPQQLVCLCEDTVSLRRYYPRIGTLVQVARLPSFNVDRGRVELLYGDNQIDAFSYWESMHSDQIQEPKGVSLERLFFDVSTTSAANWTSAASDVNYGTPGFVNSQASLDFGSTSFWLKPEVLSSTQPATEIHYAFKSGGNFVTVNVLDRYGRILFRLLNHASLSNEGSFTWNGSDAHGQRLPMGIYVMQVEHYGEALPQTEWLKVVIAP